MKKILVILLAFLLAAAVGCGASTDTISTPSSPSSSSASGTTSTVTTEIDTEFSAQDLEVGYDEATAVKITLNGDSAQVSGEGASVSGGVVTITAEGTYLVTGSLTNGQLVVNGADTDKIQLVFSGASIHNETGAAVSIKQADKVFLTLAAGTENTLTDGAIYGEAETADSVDGVIFSKADLTINGSGALNITGNYQHGIVSKDDLVVTGGQITVTAVGQGLSGKDRIKIKDGVFTLTTGEDALQSDNAEESGKGTIYIAGGTFTITTGGDGMQAETVLQIDGGSGTINTDINNSNTSGEDISQKGLKAGSALLVNGGNLRITTTDDSLHSNGSLTVSDGTLTISTDSKGLHADSALTLGGGTIIVVNSFEGMEGKSILLTGGTYNVTSSDDGLNAADLTTTSSGRPRQGSDDVFLRIQGGTLTVDASGDGLDSNGGLYLEGGEVFVEGSANTGNSALDYDGTAIASGGVLVATGSAGMAQGFQDTSTQGSILYQFTSKVTAGTEVTLTDSSGNPLASFTPKREYQSVVITAPELKQGETYTLTAGSQTAEITLESMVYSNGSSFGGKGQGGGGRGGQPPADGSRPERTGSMPEMTENQ